MKAKWVNYTMQTITNKVVSFFLAIIIISCTPSPSKKNININEPLNFRVEPARDWTDLFLRDSGWFGADGVFSIPLDGNDSYNPDREVLMIFSDTYVGQVINNVPVHDTMINNSAAIFKGETVNKENLHFFINHDKNGPISFFQPEGADTTGEYFWLGDGFVNRDLGGKLYLFAYHIRKTGENVFDFEELDVSLLRSSSVQPPFAGYEQLSTPLHLDITDVGKGNLGAGLLVNTKWAGAPDPDGYIYVYGCIGEDKNLVVSRAPSATFEDFGTWEYWSNSEWSSDINSLKPVTKAVSNELSVTPLPDGRYLLTFQVLGISDKVGIMIGASPVGPFSDIQEIYRTPEIEEGLLPYNAKAHPALSKPGELLISYNTISFDFWNDIKKDAHIYRPRFIRMIFED
ncbi:MAG: DUF4185 domain-containing protein [Saprospiraceae bacterium]|nr:DUF4185 domain-containing protein [Saprospiraceae bacterium]